MAAARSRRAISAFLMAFVAALVFFTATGRLNGPLRIDEAHKVADTVFFRLLIAGEVTSAEWFRHIVDRTNPPVGKYLFGLAATLTGAPLASSTSIRVELRDGVLGQGFSSDSAAAQHAATLRAARGASLFATAVTAGLFCVAALRISGAIGAFIATLLYLGAHLVQTFSATAVYDPLLTLCVAGTLPLIQRLWENDRPWTTAALAIVCGVASQVRLTGAVIVVIALGFIVANARSKGATRILARALLFIAITASVGIALNPYYWATPVASPSVPAVYYSQSVLPLRVVERAKLQGRDAAAIVQRERIDHPRPSLLEKVRFAAEHLAGDVVGFVTLIGIAICAYVALRRRKELPSLFVVTMMWAVVVAMSTIALLPFAWPRYLLPAVGPLVLSSAAGWCHVVDELRKRHRS